MPARSQAQRGYIYHEFGPAWAAAHHYDNPGKLPARVTPKKKGKAKRPRGKKR